MNNKQWVQDVLLRSAEILKSQNVVRRRPSWKIVTFEILVVLILLLTVGGIAWHYQIWRFVG